MSLAVVKKVEPGQAGPMGRSGLGVRDGDSSKAIAVLPNIYWIGFQEASSKLHCNPYVLLDSEDVVLFDPGSIPDFPLVMRKVMDLASLEEISLIVASHQDPDVCGSLMIVEDVVNNKSLRVAAHTKTLRLIQHLGLRSHFYAVDQNDFSITLKSGRVLQFIPAPYLHAPGAVMTYDPDTRSLFSGDLFGAVDNDWSLMAGDDHVERMASFHQAYMPSNAIIRPVMEELESMQIDWILPQHGSVIQKDQVSAAIQFLKELPCGIDLKGHEQ